MSVGLVYDPIYLEHDTGHHPEKADRLKETMAALEREELLKKLVSLAPRPATAEEVALVHSRDYISWVEQYAGKGGGWLDMDTVMSPRSYQVALYAAGGAIRAAEAVCRGEVGQAFALVRPPGHHATRDKAMGFCLFNNIAIAARYLQKQGLAQRLLIFDYDVHHGNGTQDAFSGDPDVLYFSLHQFPLYPGTGHTEETGGGNIVNVPLPPGSGDEECQQVCLLLSQVARRFRPEAILVSAGYDGHWLDGISQLQLSVTGYALMVRAVSCLADELCGGKLALVLEGGYHLSALPAAVVATFKTLLGEEIADPIGPPLPNRRPDISAILTAVRQRHGLAAE